MLPATQFQTKSDILPHRALLEQGGSSGKQNHMPILNRTAGGLFSRDPHATVIDILQAGNQSQQGAFTRTRGSQQSHKGAGLHIQAHRIDRTKGTELLAQTSDTDAHGRTQLATTPAAYSKLTYPHWRTVG